MDLLGVPSAARAPPGVARRRGGWRLSRGAPPVERRLARELPVVRRTLVASVAVGLVSTATVVVQAVALAGLLASAMPGAPPGDRPRAFVWIAAATVVRAGAALVGELLAHVGAAGVKAQLRARLLASVVARAPVSGWNAPGEVATVAGRGLDALDVYVGRCLPDLVLAVIAPVATAIAVGVLDWLSGLIVLVAIALFPIFGALVGRASMTLASDRWRQVEALGRRITDVFEGLPVLRAFGRSAEQRQRIAEAGEALRRTSLSALRTAFLSALVLDTLASVSVALVAVPLGLRLLDGSVRLASALAVLIVAPSVFLPLRRASAEFHESTEGLAAAARALALIGAQRHGDDVVQAAHVGATRPGDEGSGRPGDEGSGRPGDEGSGRPGDQRPRVPVPDPARAPVALRSVRVDVAGRDVPVLDDASLTIAPGETVVLVGPSGAGKSTVVSLVLGFVSPSAGSVTVGHEDLCHLDLAAWRRYVAYLPEHPSLLAGTLAENLRLASPAATDGSLLAALATAGAADLVRRLPAGLETRLGDGGRPISAGELQRIALARTLLRPASLYVLDEPTVHLDAAGEKTVLIGLRRALAHASALVVTHRPAVASLADRVVTLVDGRFVTVDASEVHRWPCGPARPVRRAADLPTGVGGVTGVVPWAPA